MLKYWHFVQTGTSFSLSSMEHCTMLVAAPGTGHPVAGNRTLERKRVRWAWVDNKDAQCTGVFRLFLLLKAKRACREWNRLILLSVLKGVEISIVSDGKTGKIRTKIKPMTVREKSWILTRRQYAFSGIFRNIALAGWLYKWWND